MQPERRLLVRSRPYVRAMCFEAVFGPGRMAAGIPGRTTQFDLRAPRRDGWAHQVVDEVLAQTDIFVLRDGGHVCRVVLWQEAFQQLCHEESVRPVGAASGLPQGVGFQSSDQRDELVFTEGLVVVETRCAGQPDLDELTLFEAHFNDKSGEFAGVKRL